MVKIQHLETRLLMAVDVSIYQGAGIAVIYGDDQPNEINVYSWGVEEVTGTGLNNYWLSDVPLNTVYALLGDGDDFLEMHTDARLFAYGGSGDDTLLGAGGHDRIYGQLGNDTLDGGDGNDFVVGDAGNDTITGGSGIDYLVGGAGADLIFAADGESDTINADAFDLLTIDLLLDTVI